MIEKVEPARNPCRLEQIKRLEEKMEGMSALFAAVHESSGTETDCPKFETENDALAHAKRLAALKPGDEILSGEKGKEPVRGIFMGREKGRAVVLEFDGDDRTLCTRGAPFPCISFPS